MAPAGCWSAGAHLARGPASETITHIPLPEGCLAEQLLFTGPSLHKATGDLPEPSHLSLCFTEELLLQYFSHLLFFL